jgi:phosphatidylserine decarboxylase
VLLSPADGQVMSISEMEEPDFIGGKAVKVTIFLSLFNVHINRSPMEGAVLYHQYREGKMIPAFKSHVSDINERNTIGIESADGYRILVHQITGFVARRIVWWVKPGETLQRGERFGLIRFGSCAEVVMPAGTKVTVKPGQKTRGGVTAIGERDCGNTANGEIDCGNTANGERAL